MGKVGAYTLVNIHIDKKGQEIPNTELTMNHLRSIENVEEAYVLHGIYDGIAKIEAESVDKVREIVTEDVRGFDKVTSTLTNIIVTDEHGPVGFKRNPKTGEFIYCHPSLKKKTKE